MCALQNCRLGWVGAQVLEEYARYADAVLEQYKGRPKENGWRGPSVRVLFKPLLGLFYNEPRGKKWRAAVRPDGPCS